MQTAASLNHLLGWQPQPDDGEEAAEGLKQEGSFQCHVAGLQGDLLACLSLLLSREGPLAPHPRGHLLVLPLQPYLPTPKSQVAAALGTEHQQKTYADPNDFPAPEQGKNWAFLGKPWKINTFASLCRCWQGTSTALFREDVNKPCQSPLEALTSWEGERGGTGCQASGGTSLNFVYDLLI